MFGWNIFVANFTVGALFGYSSVNCSVSLNVPPSHGVSSGPNMTACQSMIFDSVGAPEIPVGGSDCSRLKSRTRRLRAGEDMMSRRRLFARQKYVRFPSTQKTKASSFPSSLVALCLSSSQHKKRGWWVVSPIGFVSFAKKKRESISRRPLFLFR